MKSCHALARRLQQLMGKKECLEFEIGAWPIGHDKSSPVPGAILNNNTTSSILNLVDPIKQYLKMLLDRHPKASYGTNIAFVRIYNIISYQRLNPLDKCPDST